MRNAPPTLQPYATWNPIRGAWETAQLDLYGQPARCSGTWPTCGWTHDGSAYRLPLSALLTPGSASSSSPTATTLFRTPLASDSTRGGETLDKVKARRGTIALSHQIIDFTLHGPDGLPSRNDESETLCSLIEDIFTDGDATPMPSPDGSTSPDAQHRPLPSEPELRTTPIARVRGVADGPSRALGHRSNSHSDGEPTDHSARQRDSTLAGDARYPGLGRRSMLSTMRGGRHTPR